MECDTTFRIEQNNLFDENFVLGKDPGKTSKRGFARLAGLERHDSAFSKREYQAVSVTASHNENSTCPIGSLV